MTRPVLSKSQSSSTSTDAVRGVPSDGFRRAQLVVEDGKSGAVVTETAAGGPLTRSITRSVVVVGADTKGPSAAVVGHKGMVITTNGQGGKPRVSLKRGSISTRRPRRQILKKQVTVTAPPQPELSIGDDMGYYSRSLSVPIYLDCV